MESMLSFILSSTFKRGSRGLSCNCMSSLSFGILIGLGHGRHQLGRKATFRHDRRAGPACFGEYAFQVDECLHVHEKSLPVSPHDLSQDWRPKQIPGKDTRTAAKSMKPIADRSFIVVRSLMSFDIACEAHPSARLTPTMLDTCGQAVERHIITLHRPIVLAWSVNKPSS